MMIKLIPGHHCEQFGRPDHRSKEYFIYQDRAMLGAIRLTPPAHTYRWYWQSAALWNKHGVPWEGPLNSKQEAIDAVLGTAT